MFRGFDDEVRDGDDCHGRCKKDPRVGLRRGMLEKQGDRDKNKKRVDHGKLSSICERISLTPLLLVHHQTIRRLSPPVRTKRPVATYTDAHPPESSFHPRNKSAIRFEASCRYRFSSLPVV